MKLPKSNLGKKGSSVLFIIFEILVVVLIIQVVFQIAAAYGDSTNIKKVQMANDLVLMVNTLVATPGNAIVEYPGDASLYIVTLVQASVEVSVEGDGEIAYAVRHYSLPKGYTAKGTVKEIEKLCLVKEGRQITVSECAD